MSPNRTCPDCGVPLEQVQVTTDYEGHSLRIDDPEKDGLAGLLGGKTYLSTYLCPECRLVRFYA